MTIGVYDNQLYKPPALPAKQVLGGLGAKLQPINTDTANNVSRSV
jgi:hypothetical protein